MHASLRITLLSLLASTLSHAAEPKFLAYSRDTNSLYRLTLPLSAPEFVARLDRKGTYCELIEADQFQVYTVDPTSNRLSVVDSWTGSIVKSVSLDCDLWVSRRGFALSPHGQLFGVLPGMELRTVDPRTGRTKLVAPITGAARVEAIAFSPRGTLYASGSVEDNHTSEALFTLSTRTGELAPVGFMGKYDVDDLTFARDGFLYGVDSVNGKEAHLLRIDPATAVVEDLGPTGITGVTGLVAIRRFFEVSGR